MPIYLLLSEVRLILIKLLLDFCQTSYTYQLLILPNHHPTEQILSINLRDRDKSSQLGKQLENTLIWVERVKLKVFNNLWAQKVASNNAIDLTNRVELVQGLVTNTSFCDIIIKKKKVEKKMKNYCIGNELWVDGSKLS